HQAYGAWLAGDGPIPCQPRSVGLVQSGVLITLTPCRSSTNVSVAPPVWKRIKAVLKLPHSKRFAKAGRLWTARSVWRAARSPPLSGWGKDFSPAIPCRIQPENRSHGCRVCRGCEVLSCPVLLSVAAVCALSRAL